MQNFKIEIQETLSNIIDISAENTSEALSKVEKMYYDCEIVLSADDLIKVDFINHIDPQISYFLFGDLDTIAIFNTLPFEEFLRKLKTLNFCTGSTNESHRELISKTLNYGECVDLTLNQYQQIEEL